MGCLFAPSSPWNDEREKKANQFNFNFAMPNNIKGFALRAFCKKMCKRPTDETVKRSLEVQFASLSNFFGFWKKFRDVPNVR